MVRVHQNQNQRNLSQESLRREVGEIDTRAPFQSVRAAVNLFGAVADKPSLPSFKRQSSALNLSSVQGRARSLPSFKFKRQTSALSVFNSPEGGSVVNNVLEKETKLMAAEKELSKLKQRLENAETTKAQALADLETAKHTLQELKNTIHTVDESKQSVIEAAEVMHERAMMLEDGEQDSARRNEIEREREQYAIASDELHKAKQYLTQIRHDFDAALEAKLAAFQQAAEAQSTAKTHKDRADESEKEIASIKDSVEQVKLATTRSNEAITKIDEEREGIVKESKSYKDEVERKLQDLKGEYDPELATSLEKQLADVASEIQVVLDKMKRAHESEMSYVKDIKDELNEATKKLQIVAAEESELRTSVASIRLELENAKKDRAEAQQRESTRDARFRDLKLQLESVKTEINAYAQSNPDEHVSQLHQLTSEMIHAKREAEETARNAEELKQETKTARTAAEEAERELQVATAVLEGARAGEERAVGELRKVSTVCAADFGAGGAKIRMSKEDYRALLRKNEEAGKMAEAKVAAVMSQVGAINASKSDAESKVEAAYREMEDIQVATDLAFYQAEMSGAAQMAIESELQRWRQQEHEHNKQEHEHSERVEYEHNEQEHEHNEQEHEHVEHRLLQMN